MIKICVAGATGRMGGTLIREAIEKKFQIVGAVASPENPQKGLTLRELGLCNSNVKLVGPSRIRKAIEKADVYVSFSTPQAEVINLPIVADFGTRIVMGTTGFLDEHIDKLKNRVSSKVPTVFAPNFSIGVNILHKLLNPLQTLPRDYDLSIIEAHHSTKKDAPSGTAKALARLISTLRGYEENVYGRSGVSIREPGELEIMSLRAGGIPGIHQIWAAGPYELISIEHISFSRRVFAQGALYAVEWINKQNNPGVYSIDDILAS